MSRPASLEGVRRIFELHFFMVVFSWGRTNLAFLPTYTFKNIGIFICKISCLMELWRAHRQATVEQLGNYKPVYDDLGKRA